MQIDSSSQVPISLVYRADLHPQGLKGGPFPTILTGGAAANQIESTDIWGGAESGDRVRLLRAEVPRCELLFSGVLWGKLLEQHDLSKNLKVVARITLRSKKLRRFGWGKCLNSKAKAGGSLRLAKCTFLWAFVLDHMVGSATLLQAYCLVHVN